MNTGSKLIEVVLRGYSVSIDKLKENAKSMKRKLTTLYYAYKDERVKLIPKIIICIALLYALSPIDLIPDFIPVIGYLDDLLIVPALIWLAIKLIPEMVMIESAIKAENHPIPLKKNWTFAVLFIFLWVFAIYLFLTFVINLHVI